MGKTKKAFMKIGGTTILDRLLTVYRPLFSEIIISARDEADFVEYGLPIALDRFAARSSLTGIHAGLDAMTTSHGFFAACDAPFLQPGLISLLMEQAEEDDDVIIPLKEDGYREPLCAIYSKRCLQHIHSQLEADDFKIIKFFDKVKVKEVPVSNLRSGDPDFLSFFNVNRPEELKAAETLAQTRHL